MMDMRLEELQAMFEPLAKKEDILNLQLKITTLQQENKVLSDKIDTLSSRCQCLEEQMQSVYIWRNSSNLVIKLDRGGGGVESAKNRVVNVLCLILKQPGIIDKNSLRQLRIEEYRKFLFKVFLNDAVKSSTIIQNTSSLKGTDISISKDFPKEIRDQQSKLLSVRRFLMNKSTSRPKLKYFEILEEDDKTVL